MIMIILIHIMMIITIIMMITTHAMVEKVADSYNIHSVCSPVCTQIQFHIIVIIIIITITIITIAVIISVLDHNNPSKPWHRLTNGPKPSITIESDSSKIKPCWVRRNGGH